MPRKSARKSHTIRQFVQNLRQRARLPVWTSEDYGALTGGREIRLLVIKPSKDSSSLVECSLLKCSLDDPKVRFEALSYIWGRMGYSVPPIRVWMSLDGRRFDVGFNLYLGLQRLRYPDRERCLWVDAVCINQRDFAERGSQILLMRDIYIKAEQVVVWIGGRVAPSAIGPDASPGKLVERAWQEEDPEAWLTSTLGKDGYLQAWMFIATLLANRYWVRVWIVQEVSLAGRLRLYYGPNEFEWNQLLVCDRVWRNFENTVHNHADRGLYDWWVKAQRTRAGDALVQLLPNPGNIRNEMITSIFRPTSGPLILETHRLGVSSKTYDKRVVDLLVMHHDYESTNPRDKIYALLGLASDTANAAYKVDYTATEKQVLQQFVQHMLDTTQRLDIICYAGLHMALPSWVPFWGPQTMYHLGKHKHSLITLPKSFWAKFPLSFNWTNHRIWQMEFSPLHTDSHKRFIEDISLAADFAAAGDTKAEARIEEGIGKKPVLVATGCIIDEIAGFLEDKRSALEQNTGPLDPVLAEYEHLTSLPSDWLKERHDIELLTRIKTMLRCFLQTKTPMTGTAKIEAFWRTLIYNRGIAREIPDLKYSQPFETLLRTTSPTTSSATDSQETGEKSSSLQHTRDYVTPFLDLMHRNLNGAKFIPQHTLHRRVFVTKGGLLGLAEHVARKGDLVCVLKGCFRPLLVHRQAIATDDHVDMEWGRVVRGVSHCCAYLHGYMDGRAMQDMAAGLLPECTFRLE